MSKPREVKHMVLRSKILNRVIHCGPRLPTEGSGYQIAVYEEEEWDRRSARVLGAKKGVLPIPVVLLTEEETGLWRDSCGSRCTRHASRGRAGAWMPSSSS